MDFQLTPAHGQIRDMLHGLALGVLRPLSLEADRTGKFPDDLLERLAAMRGATAGADVPEEYGGDAQRKGPRQTGRYALIACEELAYGDASVLLNLPGPGLGGPPVRFMGTEEQKRRFFDVFKKPGPRWGAYGLTEPGAGSDVSAIRTSCRKDGNSWVLSGRKCYITNGARAEWVVIFATLDPKLGRAGHRAFVVEKGTPGFAVGKIEHKMGLRASETAELVLEDCRVPEENLLGGEAHYAGNEGFMGAMKTFDASRPTIGAMAVGIARAAHEAARDFVRDNYVLGRPLPRYAMLAAMLADQARLVDAARLMCWRAGWMADEGLPNAKEASMAKAYAARAAMRICEQAVQLLGAHGLERARFVEKWYRDIKVFDIFEGTAQIQRVVISKRILSSGGREAPTF
jgi:acyl-CoA dehydrogenase